MLYSKGIFLNRCYDQLNLENPSLIESIHTDYLKAGCEIIETNTFGANRARLKAHGLENKVKEINLAGAEIAKKALKTWEDQSQKTAWIAGAMGPLGVNTEPIGPMSSLEAEEVFREQAFALAPHIDLFILETFTHLSQLEVAVKAVRSVSTKPIFALLTINDDHCSLVGEPVTEIASVFNRLSADVVGFNCSSGPSIILDVIEEIKPLLTKPMACFPNAGLPKKVDGRFIYVSTPEYFASYSKRLITLGVQVIGGCCGTTPTHMKRVKDAIKSSDRSEKQSIIASKDLSKVAQQNPIPQSQKSRLALKLEQKRFVISVEIDPPKGTDTQKVFEAAKKCAEAGIDCINIADGPRASARMNPSSLAVLLERDIGIETIIHYCCRDRNLLGIQSDLLGAHALGLRNILIITGDPLKLGDYPDAVSVFDVDSVGLTRIVYQLNRGLDIGHNAIGKPTAFFHGVGVNPSSLNFDEEMRRLIKKIEAGAEYVLTQPVYDLKTFEKFLSFYQKNNLRTPVLIGICPLASLKNAEFLHNEVPGMQIPSEIMKRMAKSDRPEAQREEGIAIAREALLAFKDSVQGTYIMPPFNKAEIALQVVDGLIVK